MEEHLIDVRDVDYEYFEGVSVYLDRGFDRYHFPRESAERLGEYDEENGTFYLIDGRVETEPDEIEVNGRKIETWSVGVNQLVTRPARRSA